MKITVKTKEVKEDLGDLFGIFFEDINHAADGGLYGELVQNRAFEYSSLDNGDYRPLTGWEKLEEGGKMDWLICSEDPLSLKNPHYLVLNVTEPGERTGVRNIGFNDGIYVEQGKRYCFSCFVRKQRGDDMAFHAAIADASGAEIAGCDFTADAEWSRRSLVLEATATGHCARLEVTIRGTGRAEFDFISLFPEDTYKKRENGMRADIAQMIEDLKPRFMRFPGGCLTHDGSLDADARDSMYRWKNTLGKVTERPARRDNWGYNQTLGLGYYEYFQFCEDIGAKPLPVLPAGYNPHSGEAAPMEEMGPWIEDALDLIEFANGEPDTAWGKVRAGLGHPRPFGMEYLGIGNEEIGEPFFERYELIHKAVKEKYPEIKVINSAGPFSGGTAYERGWESARQNHSDLIDEHYYQAPEWFIANHHRYDDRKEDTKVFLGEYASCGNTWYNALAEASYMIGLEKSAHAVGLACYAPLLANADYVNWEPDLIWFNNHEVYGTPSYYIQKLFMENQGKFRLECCGENMGENICLEDYPDYFAGKLWLSGNRSRVFFSDIRLINRRTGEERLFMDREADDDAPYMLDVIDWEEFTLKFTARQQGAGWGFKAFFGGRDEDNCHFLNAGGWGNSDIFLSARVNGKNINYTQDSFHVDAGRDYDVEIRVDGRKVEASVDGRTVLEAVCGPLIIEPLYYTASQDDNGDVIVKLANVSSNEIKTTLLLDGIEDAEGKAYIMEGFTKEAVNSFDDPRAVIPREIPVRVRSGKIEADIPGESVRIYRIRKN